MAQPARARVPGPRPRHRDVHQLPGGSFTAMTAIYDTMQYIPPADPDGGAGPGRVRRRGDHRRRHRGKRLALPNARILSTSSSSAILAGVQSCRAGSPFDPKMGERFQEMFANMAGLGVSSRRTRSRRALSPPRGARWPAAAAAASPHAHAARWRRSPGTTSRSAERGPSGRPSSAWRRESTPPCRGRRPDAPGDRSCRGSPASAR